MKGHARGSCSRASAFKKWTNNLTASEWNDVKFLESATNLKPILAKSLGVPPSDPTAREISVYIEQGRLFFEAAAVSPLQIRPLQIYYGVLGFAKSIILARSYLAGSQIARTHGISDTSTQNSKLEELRLVFRKTGVFQQFNDVIAPLGRINYFDEFATPQTETKPFDTFRALPQDSSIKDVLSRIPGLHTIYAKTFGEEPACWPISFYINFGRAELRLDDPELFTDRESLKRLIDKWRGKFPFLEQWCFYEASRAWGSSVLMFRNTERPEVGEFSHFLVEGNNGFSLQIPNNEYKPFTSILPPLAGGITNNHPTVIQPLHGISFSEFSLEFCGAYLLSSLVRYRPQIWQYSLSRSSFEQSTADDRAVSLIEMFLEIVAGHFPKLVVQAMGLSK
jgi:hypothetical protein